METTLRTPVRRWARQTTRQGLVILNSLYFAGLFTWWLFYQLFGDGMGYLGLANALAVYFFFPLPLVGFMAWRLRSRGLLLACLAAGLVFAALWGPLFWPNTAVATDRPHLSVMTFNVLGRAGDPQAVLNSIAEEDADLVFLQELTPDIAWLVDQHLAEAYPHRLLEPDVGASGMGIISKYPLEESAVHLEAGGTAEPQVVYLDWQGQRVTLVNIHTRPTSSLGPGGVRATFDLRQADMSVVTDFVADLAGPIIVAGDANMTHLNTAYQILTERLDDAWWQAGLGLGHTFPGPVVAGGWATRISHFRIPPWLVRIDYIFISDEWQAADAWLADFAGGSDHRAVVAELVLVADIP